MNKQTIEQWAAQALAEKPYPDLRFPPSPYYRFLKIAAQNLKPALSVELGVCGGGGSFHLAIGNPAGIVVGVDIAAEDYPENIAFISTHCPNFRFWLGDSVNVAKDIYEEYGKAGLVFIDTIHTYQRTWEEFQAWQPYLADNALVCFDDLLRPEMLNPDFWRSLPEPKIRADRLHDGAEMGGGFGILWKE